jgi:hypothetical protein
MEKQEILFSSWGNSYIFGGHLVSKIGYRNGCMPGTFSWDIQPLCNTNKLDREITKLYRKTCNGIEIRMIDIPKVYEAAKRAHYKGRNMEEAIVTLVQSIKKN